MAAAESGPKKIDWVSDLLFFESEFPGAHIDPFHAVIGIVHGKTAASENPMKYIRSNATAAKPLRIEWTYSNPNRRMVAK